MVRRISITPGDQLRLVPNRWQAKFASISAEILIQEGRYSEVMQTITGLSLADLTGESLTLRETGKNKKKRSQKDKKVNTIYNSSNLSCQKAEIPLEEKSTQSSTSEKPLSTVVPGERINGIIEIQENLF